LTTSASVTADAALERAAITDVLYRYASCMDRFDFDGVRTVLADDVFAQYGNNGELHGADEVIRYCGEFTVDCQMQHHFLNVYHVDMNGDHAEALVYHTSHQLFERAPGIIHVLVGRYHNELRRTEDGWKISKLVLELLWGEAKVDVAGYFALVGGRGPTD
jgi:ketosteroid isomerase-like protein